jgi:hypothetical protein
MTMSRYSWIKFPADIGPALADLVRNANSRQNPHWDSPCHLDRFYRVGIQADGTLHNPNSYPEDAVRAVVLAADARKHERRSQAAKKAATTREARQQQRVWLIAKRLADKQQTGPRGHCYVCGRGLSDPPSIARGIGSECWQGVLDQISSIKEGEFLPNGGK